MMPVEFITQTVGGGGVRIVKGKRLRMQSIERRRRGKVKGQTALLIWIKRFWSISSVTSFRRIFIPKNCNRSGQEEGRRR
jgi:hypothetical protein